MGCSNLTAGGHDVLTVELTKELIARDIIVLTAGCSSGGIENCGLMTPEAAQFAGPKLRAVCEKLGIPPVLNFGPCLAIGRLEIVATELAETIGVDLPQLPLVLSAAQWLEEQALAAVSYTHLTVVVPNSILTNNSLTNVTARPERKLDLKVGISYEADLRKAKQIVEEKLRDDPSVIQDEEKRVFVDSLGDSAVVIGLRAWVKTDEYWTTRWRVLEEIKLTFDEEGIEIPYNQLTVHMKTDEETTKGNGNTLGEN